MTEENVVVAPAPRAAEPVAMDFSEEIVRFVEKRPEDRVSCKRVSGNNYRCNWWAPASHSKYDNPQMFGLTVTTHVVRKSRFLTVTKTAAGLVVRDWTPSVHSTETSGR